MAKNEFISNAEARKLHKEWAEWCERTGTLWTRLCEKAGYSASIRSIVLNQNKGMRVQTREDFEQAIAQNPNGIRNGTEKHWARLTEEQTAELAAEVLAYLERTGTDRERFVAAVGRQAKALKTLLAGPTMISAESARRYRRVIKNNPNGLFSQMEPKQSDADLIEARRFEAERIRDERFARLNAEHQQKYGKPIGRAVWHMAA